MSALADSIEYIKQKIAWHEKAIAKLQHKTSDVFVMALNWHRKELAAWKKTLARLTEREE